MTLRYYGQIDFDIVGMTWYEPLPSIFGQHRH